MAAQHRRPLYLGAARRYFVAANWPRSCLLLLALLIAGCGAYPANTSAAPGSGSQSGSQVDRAVPSVVLRNPAPSVLDVSMMVQFDLRADNADTQVVAGLGFLSGDQTVQFAGDERVTCDGIDLSLKNRAAVFQVLQASAARAVGVTIHCDYAAGGSVAGVSLQIPAAPEITSPLIGAQVVRSARTLVTYRFDPATSAVLGVVALAPSSPSPKASARLNTPGPLQATVDTSGFAPGPGSLVLTASLAPQIAATGAPFKSARAGGSAYASVSVAWV